MPKRMRMIRSEIYFPVIVGFHLLLWAVDLLFLYDGSLTLVEGESAVQRIMGEVLSSWVITVFGFNLLMASRARWVERIFGGLDKMYLIHRRSGVIAMVLLLLHFGIVPRHPEFTIGKPFGFFAMVLILLGIVLSISPFFKRCIPYHKWLAAHRLMGPFYVLGVCHAYLVPTLISKLPLTRTYVLGMSVLGVAAWFYRVFVHSRIHPRLPYEVTEIQHFGGTVVAVEMATKKTPLSFLPGQFGFFNFPGLNRHEAHPFTVASHPDKERLRVAIKASGDFSETLQTQLETGAPVQVEGPYGHFTQRWSSSRRQIWVAGGIGITPFLSLARDLKNSEADISLYWTVRTREEAWFDEELRGLADQIPGFTYRLWCSTQEGRLSADVLPEVSHAPDLDVFICGPEALRDSLTDQLHARGLPRRKIHSEEFAFR